MLLLPVVGVSYLQGLSWRLNADSLVVPLKGLLPYKKVIRKSTYLYCTCVLMSCMIRSI